jgi:hypothetical protein
MLRNRDDASLDRIRGALVVALVVAPVKVARHQVKSSDVDMSKMRLSLWQGKIYVRWYDLR